MIVPGSKKAVLRGPFGNFEVLNGPVLKDLRSVGTLKLRKSNFIIYNQKLYFVKKHFSLFHKKWH